MVCKTLTCGYTATRTRGIRGLYGYELKIFNFNFNFIIIILYTTWGEKTHLCERLYMFPVCAQTICFCLVWPLTLESSFFALSPAYPPLLLVGRRSYKCLLVLLEIKIGNSGPRTTDHNWDPSRPPPCQYTHARHCFLAQPHHEWHRRRRASCP
jgi:hypothetical protein